MDGLNRQVNGETMNAGFPRAFADAWDRPTPGKLVALLHPDVVLFQPYRPPIRGKDEAYQEFNRLLDWLPGLHGVVERSLGFDGIMFIEWQMKLPVDGKVASIRAVDRLRVEGGLATEREVYFDQVALVRAVSRSPARWVGYMKYRFGSRLR